MLTTRARWFLIVAGFIAFWAVLSVGAVSPFAAIAGLTFLTWFFAEWLLFTLRVRFGTNQLTVERQIIQNERPQPNLWAGVRATIRVTITLQPGAWRLPFVALADKLPGGLHIRGGSRRSVAELAPGQSVTLEYDVQPVAPGALLFEGVEVRAADLCGFFYTRWFLRVPVEALILPMLVGEEGHQRATKHLNTLPPPGIHRLRRPGGGTELLDLREYRPGDPPKTIAWKASARRDMLITKEYENDVPVRCTLFLDCSNAMRLGEPGDTPLSYAAGLSATLAQAIAANRDIVGACLFDEIDSARVKPARTRIHTLQLLRMLSEAAAKPPDVEVKELPLLQSLSLSVAQELYPELLGKRVNSRPLALFWRPLLDSRAKWILLIPALCFSALFTPPGLNAFIDLLNRIVGPNSPEDIPILLIAAIILFGLPWVLVGLYWFIFGIRGIFPPSSRLLGERKRLAALFCTLDGDGPTRIERYIHDDALFTARANRFLVDHRSQPPPELLDADGNYRFLGAAKADVLRDCLLRSIGTAKDNELYVLVADLAEFTAGQLEPILAAVRGARGRHHQVLVLLPWPVALPDEAAPLQEQPGVRNFTLGKLIEANLFTAYRAKFDRARNLLTRAGATVLTFHQGDATRLVLQRIEQIRHARIRR